MDTLLAQTVEHCLYGWMLDGLVLQVLSLIPMGFGCHIILSVYVGHFRARRLINIGVETTRGHQ